MDPIEKGLNNKIYVQIWCSHPYDSDLVWKLAVELARAEMNPIEKDQNNKCSDLMLSSFWLRSSLEIN